MLRVISSQDEALARYSVSREVPCSVLKTDNHEEPGDKRNPGAIIGATGSHLGFAHFLGNERTEKALQEVHENDGERRLPTKHTECIRETRILGAVVTNVKVLTFREFCDP